MTQGELHHTLNRQLASDLLEILREPAFIYVDSVEPERDRLPVARGLIEGMTEALSLADRKITSLEQMARDLAKVLRQVLQLEPAAIRRDPGVMRAIAILGQVEDMLK